MSVGLSELIKKVADDKIKVVSFDIFDTLLLRPMIAPIDAFRLVGKQHGYDEQQFVIMRTAAEKEARNQRPFGHDDVTFDEIYSQMEACFGIDNKKVQQLMKTELDVEERLLYQRKSAKKIFDVAMALNKPIVIVSDMYLPKDFIEKLLRKNGYEGYRKLYLSCDYMESKGSGKLFKRVIEDFKKEGIAAKEIFHIGDNPTADVSKAAACGLQSALLPRAIGCFNANKWFSRTSATRYGVDNTFLIGFLANLLYDDPFVQFPKDSIINGDPAYLGLITGPMLFSFVKWMLEDVKRREVDKLLLAYRDGYLPEKIIEILRPYCAFDIPVEDIYLNRTLRYAFSSKDNHPMTGTDIPFSIKMTVDEFIKSRLLLTEEEDIKEVFQIFKKSGFASRNEIIGDKQRVYRIASQLEPYFKKQAYKQMQIICEYCQEKIYGAKNLAVFDVGYRGSVARFLQCEQGCKNIIGYQLLATPHIRLKYGSIELRSYIEYGFYVQAAAMILHPLMEQLISTPCSSPIGIKKETGCFEFLYENLEYTEEQSNIIICQNRVLEYCKGFVQCFGDYISLMEFDPYNEFQLVIELCNRPAKKDAVAIRSLGFRDAVFIEGSAGVNAYENWYNRRFPSPVKKIITTAIASDEGISSPTIDVIKKVLKKLHLFDVTKKIYKQITCSGTNTVNSVSVEKVSTNELENFVLGLKEKIDLSLNVLRMIEASESRAVFCGDIVSYDKGMCAFVNSLAAKNKQYDWIFLSEATWLSQERTAEKIHIPIHIVPNLFGKNRYKNGLDITITEEQQRELEQHECLKLAAENFAKRYPDMGNGYPEYIVLEAYHYYNEVFGILKPKLIVFWNQFYALHQVIEYVARAHGATVNYMEFGSLPGTVALESMGQMGESYPSQKFAEFKALHVDNDELKQAQEVWDFLKESKLNRNQQPDNKNLSELLKKVKKNRPIVFYAGQFDFESGLCPYTEHSKKYHSPEFASSDDAAVFLGELAKKNGWEIIYKPHPLMKALADIPTNVHVIRDCDINDLIDAADVTVTIMSQSAYVASIREKPVVMLGYTQLRGKECTYEAFSRDNVEKVIGDAIAHGMTPEMKENFVRHIAQMNKYYLYDDNMNRILRYGQSINEIQFS